jgi:hypothetical protein
VLRRERGLHRERLRDPDADCVERIANSHPDGHTGSTLGIAESNSHP